MSMYVMAATFSRGNIPKVLRKRFWQSQSEVRKGSIRLDDFGHCRPAVYAAGQQTQPERIGVRRIGVETIPLDLTVDGIHGAMLVLLPETLVVRHEDSTNRHPGAHPFFVHGYYCLVIFTDEKKRGQFFSNKVPAMNVGRTDRETIKPLYTSATLYIGPAAEQNEYAAAIVSRHVMERIFLRQPLFPELTA